MRDERYIVDGWRVAMLAISTVVPLGGCLAGQQRPTECVCRCEPAPRTAAASRPAAASARTPPDPDTQLLADLRPMEPREGQPEPIDDAARAYFAGHHGVALRIAKRLADSGREPLRAWRIVGAAACYTRRQDLALVASRNLCPNMQAVLRRVCVRRGIKLPRKIRSQARECDEKDFTRTDVGYESVRWSVSPP